MVSGMGMGMGMGNTDRLQERRGVVAADAPSLWHDSEGWVPMAPRGGWGAKRRLSWGGG